MVGSENKTETWPAYSAFGLHIRSQIDLPELARAASGGPPDLDGPAPDVLIRWGAAPTILPGARHLEPGMQVVEDDFLLDAPTGRYRVTQGRLITVDSTQNASARDIRLYLLGTAMGALLHQRAVLPLHANAVRIGDAAVALAGPSGAGKSTLAAQFQIRGRQVLCDDVCVVGFNADKTAWAWPGVARIKLWDDALCALGLTRLGAGHDFERVADDMAKFNLPIASGWPREPLPLARLYVLRPSLEARGEITPLFGAEALNAVVSNVYRWPLAVAMGGTRAQFDNCVRLLGGCKVFEIATPWGFDALASTVDALERLTA